MKTFLKIILNIIIVILLTIITQIGGLVYLISLLLSKFLNFKKLSYKLMSFLILYLISTFFIVPFTAPMFGRIKLQNSHKMKPANYMTVLLNRNYVVPKLHIMLISTEISLAKSDIQITYLDANFPFFDGFPLIPHLSHSDGKKIDLSLIYENKYGKITNKQKSISGYGYFEEPKPNEYNQIDICEKKGFYQYSLAKYLKFGEINKDLFFSEKGTKRLINTILKNKDLGKIFIEPHLKSRLNLNHSKIRFHGCHAVRHDDHIHIQLK